MIKSSGTWPLAVLLMVLAPVFANCAPTGPSPAAAVGSATAVVDTGRVLIDGGSLYWEAAGSGPPVVLIHGGNLDRRMWDPQVAVLRRSYRVIRYDARGFGRSSPADAPFRAHDDLGALLRGLRIPRASLVGLSMGGRIAIDFTLAHPEMVDRLVLAAPGISGGKWADDGDSLWLAAAHVAANRGDTTGVALAWLESAYIRTALHPPERAAWIRQILLENTRYWAGIVRHHDVERGASAPAADRLAELRLPILLLVGDRDTPFIQDVARAIEAHAPHVQRVDVHGAGHMLNLEAAAEFNRAVLDFLERHCPPADRCR
jgi:3-oxoadipate enol-lactonase